MGMDFVRIAAKPFRKGLDRSRIDLAKPDLLTQNFADETRAYSASLVREGVKLKAGDELLVTFNEAVLVAKKGMDTIAKFDSPSPELIEAMNLSHGIAYGIVHEVYDMAGKAEIRVC